jgi:hypothetical protein
MAERSATRAKQAPDDLRQIAGLSTANEIERLDQLKSTGSISEQEYARLRVRLLQQVAKLRRADIVLNHWG